MYPSQELSAGIGDVFDFFVGREDVLSKGVGTIKCIIQWMYGLNELPSSELLIEYFAKSSELGDGQKPVCRG